MSVDLKTIKQLIALCRKTGVSELEVEGIKLKLSSYMPNRRHKKQTEKEIEDTPFYSEEDALFWSSAGLPGEVN